MAAFTSPVDIANRALQHCGARRIATSDFSEISKNCAETSSVYDKLRRAELQLNTWRFAIRTTILRPVDTTTMLLQPTLWQSGTTYFVGSIVADANNNYWISNQAINVGNNPLLSSAWEPYFGAVTVDPWDSTGGTAYFVGELVYTAPGDGTYRVFMSRISSNSDDPLVKTVWLSTATYYTNQVVTFYPNWASGTTYAFGATVTYQSVTYVSISAGNIGNTPSSSSKWMALTLTSSNAIQTSEWNITTTYSTNTVVDYSGTLYIASATSTGLVPPLNAGSWTALTGGVAYQSLIDLNTNNEPDLAPALWSSSTTYASGQKVGGSDGMIYTSKSNGNLNHDPTLDLTSTFWTNTGVLNPWTTVFTGGSGSVNWLEVGGSEFQPGVSLVRLNILWPIGTGPVSQLTTRNVFRLPANFLRKAPRDSKAGIFSPLGAPANLDMDDWEFRGNYFISTDGSPTLFAFVSDMVDVTMFDDMFCEGLGARIGLEVCQTLTQSDAKLKTIADEYKKFMGEAVTSNAILIGVEEPPLDDWLSCRL